MNKKTSPFILLLILTLASAYSAQIKTSGLSEAEIKERLEMEAAEWNDGWEGLFDTEGIFDFFDRKSLVRRNGVLKAWIKTRPLHLGKWPGSIYPPELDHVLRLRLFDCRKRTVTTVQVVYYGADGTVIELDRPKQGRLDVVPRSFGESTWAYLCKQTQKNKSRKP